MMQKFATTGPISAVLDVPAGRVQFIAADRADATVEIRPADATKGRDVKATEQTSIAYGDGVLRIAVPAKNQLFGGSGSVEVTVQLPAGSRVEVKAAAVEFRSVGRLGDVTVDGAHGEIKLDEAAAVRLAVLAGDVSVGRLNGSAEISAMKGDIRIAEAGDVTISAATGVSASLDAGTTYGRVQNQLLNTAGPAAELNIQATTSYGDIVARSL
jgi:DUF4097 and DUF4098 domain-containing protein YvlB